MSSVMDAAFLVQYGATPAEATARLRQELTDFAALFDLYADRWTLEPQPGVWSPAQVIEHVIKVNTSGSKLLYTFRRDAPLPDTQRVPGRLQGGKMKAPANLEPGEPQAPEPLREAWATMEGRLLAEREATSAWETKTFFHPFYGDLTPLGWVQTLSHHMRGHREGLARSFGEA